MNSEQEQNPRDQLAEILMQVHIHHRPELEDDDQGPFLHESDARALSKACRVFYREKFGL